MKHFLLVQVLMCAAIYLGFCDDENNFEYLCEGSNDATSCVRDFFDENADCSVISDVNDKPMRLKGRHNTYIPMANSTLAIEDTYFSNLNGTIESFYINHNTSNLIMSVHFVGVHIDAKRGILIIHQRSKEPLVVVERAYATYVLVLTAIIPFDAKITHDVMKNSMITAYLPQDYLEFYVGPKITESDDPVVASVAKKMVTNLPTAIDELFLTGAAYFFEAYLEKNICHFGFPFEEAE